MNDNEDGDDPEVDEDENMMNEEKKNKLETVDNFSVVQLQEPKSKFDKEKNDEDNENAR